MAGETAKTRAVCLDIRPWSRTSHIVTWLAETGPVTTSVKGAVRPKSQFLGQYDFNYSCELVYYLNSRGDIHALRECMPADTRDYLREDWRRLSLAAYFRSVAGMMCPNGPEARKWLELLESSLDELADGEGALPRMIRFDLAALDLAGIGPDFGNYSKSEEWSTFSLESGRFGASGRSIRMPIEVCEYLAGGARAEKNSQITLEAARVIGVYYSFHTGHPLPVRRLTAGLIANTQEKEPQEKQT